MKYNYASEIGLMSHPWHTLFDRLIAAATITFSKQNPVATMRRQLLWACVAVACGVYMDS